MKHNSSDPSFPKSTDPAEQARFIYSNGRMIFARVYQMQTAYLASMDTADHFRDMTVAQMHTIMRVSICGELTMGELAAWLGVSPPSASAIVDRLVEKNMLERRPSQQDRRKVIIRISPEAIPEMESINEALLKGFIDLVEKLGPETSQMWCQVLDQVGAILDKEKFAPS